MLYALLALNAVEVLLLSVLTIWVMGNNTKLEWLRQTLIPFLTNLSQFINPEKK